MLKDFLNPYKIDCNYDKLIICSNKKKMNARIAQFERMWEATRIPPPPRLERSVATEEMFPRNSLVRQTNEHELLPTELRNRWWMAETASERMDIMFEYEAMNW